MVKAHKKRCTRVTSGDRFPIELHEHVTLRVEGIQSLYYMQGTILNGSITIMGIIAIIIYNGNSFKQALPI